jgi:CheY-like chemotaxis protein
MKRILIADDDIRIQHLLMEELREGGYHVSIASNGKEALLQLLGTERTDLLILDLRMPVMDGLETMGHILKLRLGLPIIIYTAYGSYRNDPLAASADAYVVKSSDLSELKGRIHDLMDEGRDYGRESFFIRREGKEVDSGGASKSSSSKQGPTAG